MELEWDPDKNETNQRKHGVSFEEASEVFTGGESYLDLIDEEHSGEEPRSIAIGMSSTGVLFVVYTERHTDIIRIISARKALARERLWFQQWREQ